LQWVVDGYIVTFAGLLLSAGWLGDRIGSRKAFLAGAGALRPRLAWLRARPRPDRADRRGRGRVRSLSTQAPYAVLILPMAASGLGISFSMVAATTAVVEAAPPGQAGIASGVLNAARQVGSALGVALLGALLIHSARLSLLVGAAAYGAALLCSFVVRPTKLPART
jgi:MFS transporter, DHA2 family, methylenomycin A resistance protein